MTAGHWSADAPRRRVPVAGLGLAAFVTGLAVASWIGGGDRGHATTREEPEGAAPASAAGTAAATPGPAGRERGVPAGFARTREGAVAAAASFVTTGQALLDMDPLAAGEAVRQMAAAATADARAEELVSRLAALRRTLTPGTGPIVYRQSALAWRIEGFTPDRARVAIWSVGVLSRDGVAPPQAGWAVSRVDLVWERGDWRLWAETVTPGPTPIPDDSAPPATSAQLAAALDGFTDFGSAR